MAEIKIDQLAAEITLAVQEYTEGVTDGIVQELDATSKRLTKQIANDSPYKTKEYKKGWKRKKTTSGGSVTYKIYNKNKPWLAHLLEFGHVKRGGGRVEGKPHIRPNYDKEAPELERRIKAIIKNGG